DWRASGRVRGGGVGLAAPKLESVCRVPRRTAGGDGAVVSPQPAGRRAGVGVVLARGAGAHAFVPRRFSVAADGRAAAPVPLRVDAPAGDAPQASQRLATILARCVWLPASGG